MSIPTILPLSVLEALRNLDTPVEDGLDELAGEIVAKRLGLSATVAAQISRYQRQIRRGQPVPLDEAVSVFRLAGRRPDADLVFADAGRRVARHAARRRSLVGRALAQLLPGRFGRAMGARAAVRAAERFLGVALLVEETGAVAAVERSLSILAEPEGGACRYYGAALAELLRVCTGFEGAMIHETCRGRGDDSCRWRATAVGGYD